MRRTSGQTGGTFRLRWVPAGTDPVDFSAGRSGRGVANRSAIVGPCRRQVSRRRRRTSPPLLARWQSGEEGARDRAAELVYPELRRIAAAYLRRERASHTLQPTALVHEAFIRLVQAGRLQFDGRQQFYALAAQLMRHILVDHARAALARKRGGDAAKVSLDGIDLPDPRLAAGQFLELHEALERLAADRSAQGAGRRAAPLRRPDPRGGGRDPRASPLPPPIANSASPRPGSARRCRPERSRPRSPLAPPDADSRR